MKSIIAKLVNVAPIIIVVVIAAYITEELVEDFLNEPISDFVYPIAGLIILYILWRKVMPTVQAYLTEETKSTKPEDTAA